MTRHGAIGGVVLALGAAALLSGCGNGGNGGATSGGGSGASTIALESIYGSSSTTGPEVRIDGVPNCSAILPLNATISIEFKFPVDPSSLPNATTGGVGFADGAIRIIKTAAGVTFNPAIDAPIGSAALGGFSVIDSPNFPIGNQRIVRFIPIPPADPNAPCASGLGRDSVYTITIPQGPFGPVLIVGGSPLQTAVTACFSTCFCDPLNGGASVSPPCGTTAFTDPVPGAPFVVSTVPPMANPSPAPIDPAVIPGNVISISISEPLSPGGVNPGNVVVKNSVTGAQVPGTVAFFQTGTLPGLTTTSLIEYRAAMPLLKGIVYELTFGSGINDFGGTPIQISATNPLARLFFTTIATAPCPQTPFEEPFDTIANRSTQIGAIEWASPVGVVQSTYPADLVGTGTDGAVTVLSLSPPGTVTPFDTNQTILVGGNNVSRQGKWNFASFTVNAGGVARFHGIWPVHIRSIGAVVLNGEIRVNAGALNPATFPSPPNPAYEHGPRNGVFNEGASVGIPVVPGGRGNGGGGDGGRASHNTAPPPSTTPFGEFGYGPSVLGVPNIIQTDAFFAGGDGGDSGFFAPPTYPGESGGTGGAGGTAATMGEAGLQRSAPTANPPCAPVTSPPQTILAQPRPVTTFFLPPISVQSAGSGGGGGGDKQEAAVGAIIPPAGDDQGGGGGGSGGGVRISCVDNFSINATGAITANGAQGGLGNSLGGHGGSGSGGQVWIQSFSAVNVNGSAQVSVFGPVRVGGTTTANGCSNQAAGTGGQGLIQLEAGVGTPNTTFGSSAGSVVQTAPFPFTSSVSGEVLSTFFDTGNGNPDITSILETASLGNLAGATLEISYEGAFESVSGASPDISTLKTTLGNIPGGTKINAAAAATELDGYRFLRFRIRTAYPAPTAATVGAISTANLPSVSHITINYSIGCP